MAPTGSPRNGTLIALEGIDGSGKSTIARSLASELRAQGRQPLLTQEPTDTFLGTAVREALRDPQHDPISEALLFAADHAQHIADLAAPLSEGRTVITDRWSTSWRVYQSLTLQDALDTEPRAWLKTLVDPFERDPDLVLLLDLPVETAMDRMDGRGQATEKFETAEFLKHVRGRYLELAQTEGHHRIDATQSLEDTAQDCLAAVQDALEDAS